MPSGYVRAAHTGLGLEALVAAGTSNCAADFSFWQRAM